jgi:superfamily II DNA/RNA helicase
MRIDASTVTALDGPCVWYAAPATAAAAPPDATGEAESKRHILTAQSTTTSTTLPAPEPDAAPDIEAAPPARPKPFSELGVDPSIVEALAADGIHTAFPIQELTLPLALAGQDLIGQAKTGTGKTLGFGIPLLMKLTAPADAGFDDLPDAGKPQALVVVPTRELGIQVASDLAKAGRLRAARVLCVYGGRAYEPQVEALQAGIEVVVGTPGRLIDLARQRHLDLGHVRVLVLDEADEMLDMGFLPDVERIVAQVPAVRQTMLFSATMPGSIVSLARRYMTQPTHIRAVNPHDDSALVDATEQHVWRAHSMDKNELIARALQAEGRGLCIIFCRTKRNTQRVADNLEERGFAVGAVHGDLGQGAREQALRAFRSGKVDVLVATDVAARGIDVADVTHVINWECPDDEKTYLHRIGRTGRAGNSGVAITLVDWDDLHKWKQINNALGLPFADPIETYSNSEHIYTGLGIPPGTKGRLPRSARTRAGLGAEKVEDLGETGKAAGRRAHSDSARPTGSRDSGRGTSGGKDGSGGEAVAREPRKPRNRNRKRTRGGASADQPATSEATATASATRTQDAESAGAPRPDGAPRRRRRGGRGRGGGGGTGGEPAAE